MQHTGGKFCLFGTQWLDINRLHHCFSKSVPYQCGWYQLNIAEFVQIFFVIQISKQIDSVLCYSSFQPCGNRFEFCPIYNSSIAKFSILANVCRIEQFTSIYTSEASFRWHWFVCLSPCGCVCEQQTETSIKYSCLIWPVLQMSTESFTMCLAT